MNQRQAGLDFFGTRIVSEIVNEAPKFQECLTKKHKRPYYKIEDEKRLQLFKMVRNHDHNIYRIAEGRWNLHKSSQQTLKYQLLQCKDSDANL